MPRFRLSAIAVYFFPLIFFSIDVWAPVGGPRIGLCQVAPQDGPVPDPAEQVLPPGDTSPVLRLETGGPRSYVSGVAFSPDGSTLYSCGWDKAVQIWNRMPDGRFEYSQAATLRVPTGSGLYGGLNALVLSSDGEWLATAGQGHARDMSSERSLGWILPASVLSPAAQFDEGLIYVFNTKARTTRLLRGHRGPVQSLAFVRGKTPSPELVSVAEERSEGSTEIHPRIRYWDVARAIELSSLNSVPNVEGKVWGALPDLNGWRPGLTAWSTGTATGQARVAMAWGDEQFRIWDTKTGQVTTAKSSPNMISVLLWPGQANHLLTGAHADIGLWSVPTTASGGLGVLKPQHYQAAKLDSIRSQNLPTVSALISGGTQGQPTAVFVVTRYLADGRAEYRLLFTTATLPIKSIREFELPWRGEVRMPALAVSNDGHSLAVTGGDANEIAVYPVNELIAGRNPSPQVLGSRGMDIRDAGFARSENRWGLILSDVPRTVPDTIPDNAVVLDIQKRRIQTGTSNWRIANASLEDWSVENSKPGSLSIRRAGQSTLNLQLDDLQIVSSYAFCPQSPHCPVPLIAVATHLRGQPLLRIFRGDTGAPIRWCVGHTERIRGLAFSEDGRMLLSVAADRTVSVWTMTDLVERTLDKRGRIAGVTVHSQGGRLIVSDAPAKQTLRRGDEIIAVDRKGELIAVRSPKEFYQFVLDRRPGDEIGVSVRRGANVEVIKCEIGQAIDESKPLFSLFITPGENRGDWDWIGWHPLGNFDASRDDVERMLGWHFNTGEANRPAKFAAIGEYREGFFRRDLLQSLIETQKLILPDGEESPQVSCWLRYSDGTPVQSNYEDRLVVQSPDVAIVAEVTGISDRRIRNLSVSFDDAEPLSLQRGSEREWTASLSKFGWTRGGHRMSVRLQTPDREVTKTERIQYTPAAPSIEWEPPWKGEIREAEVTVKAAVIPASEPVLIQLRLQRSNQDEAVVVQTWRTQERIEITQVVAVDPGENRLELIATNVTAPEVDRHLESAHISSFVRRAIPPMAPRIVLNDVFAVPERGDAVALAVDGNMYRSPWPNVRLRGRITSGSEIESATVRAGDQKRDFDGFKPGRDRNFNFEELLTLAPGSQSLVFDAEIAGEHDTKRIAVTYEPPLPRIASLEATSAIERALPKLVKPEYLVFYAGYHEPSVKVLAVLDGRLELPYRASILLNDVPIADELITIDRSQPNQHRLTASIPMTAGKNHLVVRLENDWNRPISRAIEVDYRRPPEIVQVLADDKLLSTSQPVAIRVRSALPLRSASIIVDDVDERRDISIAKAEDKPGEWLLQTNQFGLSVGDHTLRISAINDDGMTLEPVVQNIRMKKAAALPPTLTLVAPIASATSSDKSLTVNSSKLQIRYLVNSTAPTSLRVKNRGNSAKFETSETTISADKVPIGGEVGVTEVELFQGVNEVELTADNHGGSSEKQILKIAYVPLTATIEIVSVGDERPRLRNDGSAHFEHAAPKSRMLLKGRVQVSNRSAIGDQIAARIWVNQFKLPTVSVVMDGSDSISGRFETEIVFNRLQTNEIRVEVFRADGRMASELGSTNTVVMDCAAPEREQELYVLLLGTGDSEQMRDRARTALLEKAFRAKPMTKQQASQEVWESDSFAQIHVHDALNAPPAVVQNRLRELVGKMLRNLKRTSKNNPQSIVMIYYQGQITLTNDDFAFGKLDPSNPLTRAITGRILEENLTRSYGAHLIFLDLQQDAIKLSERDVWPKAPHLGITVSNWNGPGAQPEESRMISVLEDTLPKTKVVRELAEKMAQRFGQSGKLFPGHIESLDLLKNLYDLRIGKVE